MSPSGWSARGDSNPDLHGLSVPRLPIAPRADDVIGPSGWTRTTTSRVKSPACCVHTTKGKLQLERMAGLEPAPQGLEGPRATVTPHSRWFGLRASNPSLRAGNAGCILHTQAERGPVSLTGPSTFVGCQRPRSCEHIRSYRPFWRQRQDSNPDPRGLEARMLPLHHAVVAASDLDRFRDKPSP
jgi:hypothetical protein